MKITKETKLGPTAIEKPVVRDPFFDRVKDFENKMMRNVYEMFGPFFGERGFEDLFESETEYLPVPIELRETDEGFVLYAELPGFKEKEIELRVEPWRVYLSGKHEKAVEEERKGKHVYSEWTANQFARWLEVPCEVNPEKVKATLNKGVLEITLQKVLPAKKVPIEVKAA